jgi:hypothetical protein
MELLAFLTLVLLVGAVVTTPLRRHATGGALDAPTAALEAARDAKLREIHDNELDHATGKLSDRDFATVDAALRADAAGLLRDLEELREAAAP